MGALPGPQGILIFRSLGEQAEPAEETTKCGEGREKHEDVE